MSNINYKLRSRRGNVHAPFKSPLPAKQDSNSVRDVTTFFQHIEDAKKQCAQLDEEIQSLMSEGLSVKELDLHIDMLHQYNEIKDATQTVLGRIAVIDGVTIKELHERYNLRLDE